jgi:gluconokinase
MTFCYVLDESLFVCGGPVNNGGNLVQWLIKKFWGRTNTAEKDFEAFFDAVSTVSAGSEGLLFLPYVYGERAPVWDERASGVFVGVRDHHTTAHFLRAGLEGLCLSLRQVANLLETKEHPLREIYASGGFTQSPVWVKMLADVMGKPVHVQEGGDASALGAAYQAMKAAGYLAAYPPASSGSCTYPDPPTKEIYDACFVRFQKIYPAIHSIE